MASPLLSSRPCTAPYLMPGPVPRFLKPNPCPRPPTPCSRSLASPHVHSPFCASTAPQNLVNIVFAFAVALAVLHAFPSLTAGMSKGAQATARVGMVAYMCIVVSACIATILVGLARTNASGNEGHFRAFEGYVWAQVWSAQWLHMMVHALFFAAFDLFHGSKEIMPVYLLIAVLWNATSYLTDTANKGESRLPESASRPASDSDSPGSRMGTRFYPRSNRRGWTPAADCLSMVC